MTPPKIRDACAILGVEPTASPEEVRRAYLERAREIHPDRFDFRTQPVEWRRANDELALLNEAYAALRGEAAWQTGEDSEAGADGAVPSGPAAEPGRAEGEDSGRAGIAYAIAEVTAGEASFHELPRATRARLLARQQGLLQDQVKVGRQAPLAHAAALAGLLCWFVVLFLDGERTEWGSTRLMAYTVVTTLVGLLMGRSLARLLRWARSPLEAALYITPLYFIKTDCDVVSFAPLWKGGGSAELRRRSLFPWGAELTLSLAGPRVEAIRLASRQAADRIELKLRELEGLYRKAVEGGRLDYILENDDFHGVRRRTRAQRRPATVRGEFLMLVLPLLASWAAFAVAVDMNLSRMQARLARQPDPAIEAEASAARRTPSRARQDAVLDRPAAVPGGLTAPVPPVDPATGWLSPLQGLEEGKGAVPAAPSPREAVSTPPAEGEQLATFRDSRLFLVSEGPPGAKDLGGGSSDYRPAEPLPPPLNGHVTRFHDAKEAIAPFEIELRETEKDLFLTMEDWETRRPVLTVFIRRGQTVKLKVPLGSFRLKYAAGRTWYGEARLFGPGGAYGGSDERMDFSLQEEKVTGRKLVVALKGGSGP